MNNRSETKLSAAAISFIPLFYVAWSDSVLSPSEIKVIQQKMKTLPFLTASDKKYLERWTDPKEAPSEAEFKLWHNYMKTAAKTMDIGSKNGLIELGLNMAQSGVAVSDLSEIRSPEVLNALKEIHDALGLSPSKNLQLIEGLPAFKTDENITSDAEDALLKLQSILDAPHSELKIRIRRLLQDPLFALKWGMPLEEHRSRVLGQLKELAAQGLSAYAIPIKYGGYEKKGDHIAVFEMLGYGDLSLAIKFGVQFGLFGGAIHLLGTEKHHTKYLESMHRAELLGCFAMTETGHGSNVKNLETTATYDHDTGSLIINSPNSNAGKEYIGNALHATMAVVFAQLIVNNINQGVHAVLVPLRDSQHQLLDRIRCEDCGHKMGLNGVDNGRLWFDHVAVPLENLLDKYGQINDEGIYQSPIKNASKRFFTMLGALVTGRICVGLIGINAAKVALSIAIKYGNTRRQFAAKDGDQETLILDYPSHQKRLFPLLAQNYAYYFAMQDLAARYSEAKESEIRKIETLAAGLKAKSTWYATACIQECREACGGKAYLSENRFASLKADSDIFTTFEGDNTVLMQLVAKGLMTEFKQTFHDDGYRAVLRFLLTKVKHEGYENNPIFKRNTDSSHLLDVNFHFHAFNYRQRKTLIALSDRMRKYLKRGMDPYQAFLKVQIHMIDLADAYIDQVCLKAFYDRIDRCEDSDLKRSLTLLAQLYALETLKENKAWYLESDYMDGSKTKAIRRVIGKLYQEIRPRAIFYVDAFNIPQEMIAAEIMD